MREIEWDFPKPYFDPEFYETLRAGSSSFRLLERHLLTLEEGGKGFVVRRGCTARIICVEGPQIVDVCLYNAENHKERFWNDQTLNREGPYVTTFSRLWSNMPKFRPMMTIIEDTVENKPSHPHARHHYVFGAHCNPYYWFWALKDRDHPYVTEFNCYYNLSRAVRPFGLTPDDLHDNLNLFQKCYFELDTGMHRMEPSDAKPGDYVEFYAEIDVLMALSICPNGSGKHHWSEREQDVKPIEVELYETGIPPLEHEDQLSLEIDSHTSP